MIFRKKEFQGMWSEMTVRTLFFQLILLKKLPPSNPPWPILGVFVGSKTEYDINNGLFDQIISK